MWKKFLLVALLIVLSLQLSSAQSSLNTQNVENAILVWFGCEGTNCAGLTVDNTAGGVVLTSTQYNPTVTDKPAGYSRAQIARCYNSGQKIWITESGTITLATGKGRAYADATYFNIYGYTNISNLHAIRDGGSNSTLYCDYYRLP